MTTILDFIENLAVQSGDKISQLFNVRGIKSSEKFDHTLITKADLISEDFIASAISKTFPNDGILSEEGNTIYPADKEFVWVIDPLDGTTNFSLGLHYWGISIARLHNGIPETAAIYFPLIDELFSAQDAKGAKINGKPLLITDNITQKHRRIFAVCSRAHKLYKISLKYKIRILGSAAFNICSVASGSAILSFDATSKIWDISGAWLILSEAGGKLMSLDGNSPFPLIPNFDYREKSIPLLAAPNDVLLEFGYKHISKK